MRSSRLALLGSVAFGLLLAACGSRSSLAPGDASGEGGIGGGGGAGGTGAGNPTSTSSSGGSGGSVTPPCNVLLVDGPPLSPVPAIGNKQFVPWLVRTEPDGSRAALAYYEVQDPASEFLLSSSVALDDPWGPWPASLPTSASHGQTEGVVAGPASEGRFSMLTNDVPNNMGNVPTGMVVWTPVAGVPGMQGQYFDDVPPGSPVLVTSNGGEHLAGFQRAIGAGLQHLTLARISADGGPFSFGDSVTCALDTGLAGAAIPFGGGFLSALSNGRPYGSCLTDDLPDGPPTRLQIVSIPSSPATATLTYEQEQPASFVFQAHLTPAEGGAWAAWERIPFEPPYDRRIQLLQLDAAGFPVNGKVIEVDHGIVSAPLAIASLGSRVALATVRQLPGEVPVPVVGIHVLSEDGSLLAEAGFTAGEGFSLDYSVALLSSPAKDHLLLAWSESSAINNDDRRVRVARLVCSP